MGSLISEFVTVHEGHYVVRASVQIGSLIVATGLASGTDIESTEDRAKVRAIEAAGITGSPLTTAPPPYAPASEYAPLPRSTVSPAAATSSPTPPVIASGGLSDDIAIAPPSEMSNSGDRPLPTVAIASTAPPIADLYAYASLEAPIEDGPPPRLDEIDVVPLSKLTKRPKPAASVPQTPTVVPPLDGTLSQPSAEPSASGGSVDLSEVLAQIDVEMMRLGWTKRQGRDYLKQHYGKATRSELDVEELFDFLQHLQSQPTEQGVLG